MSIAFAGDNHEHDEMLTIEECGARDPQLQRLRQISVPVHLRLAQRAVERRPGAPKHRVDDCLVRRDRGRGGFIVRERLLLRDDRA